MRAQHQGMYLISAVMFVVGLIIVYQALAIYKKNDLAIYGVIVMAYSILRLHLMKRFRTPRDTQSR